MSNLLPANKTLLGWQAGEILMTKQIPLHADKASPELKVFSPKG